MAENNLFMVFGQLEGMVTSILFMVVIGVIFAFQCSEFINDIFGFHPNGS